jgi:hypothetical protein
MPANRGWREDKKAILAGDAAEVQPHRLPVPNVSAYNRNFFVPFA